MATHNHSSGNENNDDVTMTEHLAESHPVASNVLSEEVTEYTPCIYLPLNAIDNKHPQRGTATNVHLVENLRKVIIKSISVLYKADL
jgi:hypothetical protein